VTISTLQESSDESTSTDKASSKSAHSGSGSSGLSGAGAGTNRRAVGIGSLRVARIGTGCLGARWSWLGNDNGGAVVGRDSEGRGGVVGTTDGDGLEPSANSRDGNQVRN
jgi:hypothetical protein